MFQYVHTTLTDFFSALANVYLENDLTVRVTNTILLTFKANDKLYDVEQRLKATTATNDQKKLVKTCFKAVKELRKSCPARRELPAGTVERWMAHVAKRLPFYNDPETTKFTFRENGKFYKIQNFPAEENFQQALRSNLGILNEYTIRKK